MKKKIALFANGWGSEFLHEIGRGVLQCAKQKDADVFAFINFTAHEGNAKENMGEFNIFKLPDLTDFDGIMLLANSFNMEAELDYLYQGILKNDIPAISLEYHLDGIDYIGTDNYSGMYELTVHMIRKHGVRRIMFIGGFESHLESQIRMKAVLDAAKDSGIGVPEDNILYGSWAEDPAREVMEEWTKKHDYLPDVVICANDIMAAAVCDWLNEHGHSVPGKVKVTGYDSITISKEHQPVITSVSRNWDEMGFHALERLIDRIEGKELPPAEEMKTKLVCGESCGCVPERDPVEVLEEWKKIAHKKMVDGFTIDSHFRHLYKAVRKDETAEQFSSSLSAYCQNEGWMEGKDFMMCLHPQFFSYVEEDDIFEDDGYPEEMDVICSMRKSVPEQEHRMEIKKAMFRAAEENTNPGVYLFVPLKSDNKTFGFAMLSRNFDIVRNNVLYIWTRHMNQYLEQIRSNVKIAELTRKLRELSVTDILTGVYNRTGCEKVIYPFLGQCQKRGGRGVVMMADIDRMKTINDKFGHAQGDLALMIVSSVLVRALPPGFLVGRYGGDEFFIGGESDGVTTVDEIIEKIAEELRKEIKEREIEFELTLSLGGVELAQGEVFELSSCLQKADEFMYEQKRKHHGEEEKRRAEEAENAGGAVEADAAAEDAEEDTEA